MLSRRTFLATMGAAACTAHAGLASAQSQALPLDNLGLEHLDIVVPDPAASAKFYMRVFKTRLHQQPVRDTLRYFILLGDLPTNRQVGYIAIGAANGRPPAFPGSASRAAWACGPIRTASNCSCFSRRPGS